MKFSLPPLKLKSKTTMSDSPSRHVPISVIEDYLKQGVDGTFGIEGIPPARLVVESASPTLAVRFPDADLDQPDVATFANLSIDRVQDEGSRWSQLAVKLDDNVGEVHAVLCNVIDRVQLLGSSFANAVREALDSLSGILASRSFLALERQVGLAGELLTLLALADEVGPREAVASWRGPFAEEHDFGLAGEDLEVKVTLSERRRHWISSATQLVPTGNRPLFLLSIQLTRAAASSGWSLQSLVELAGAIEGMPVERLRADLESSGYRPRDVDLYPSHWDLRTPPNFYRVDSEFPVISRRLLERFIPASERIVDVRYRVDLTALPESAPLFSFSSLEGRNA